MGKVAVTQADREAARKFMLTRWPSWDSELDQALAELANAFARHPHRHR